VTSEATLNPRSKKWNKAATEKNGIEMLFSQIKKHLGSSYSGKPLLLTVVMG
jgi:hypothetical protein